MWTTPTRRPNRNINIRKHKNGNNKKKRKKNWRKKNSLLKIIIAFFCFSVWAHIIAMNFIRTIFRILFFLFASFVSFFISSCYCSLSYEVLSQPHVNEISDCSHRVQWHCCEIRFFHISSVFHNFFFTFSSFIYLNLIISFSEY